MQLVDWLHRSFDTICRIVTFDRRARFSQRSEVNNTVEYPTAFFVPRFVYEWR
jgi:hypothetical protein